MIDSQTRPFWATGETSSAKEHRLIQPITDQVFNEVRKKGVNKRYDFIFDKSRMWYVVLRKDIFSD